MNNVAISNPMSSIFSFFEENMNGTLNTEAGEYNLTFNNEIGKGKLKGIKLNGPISFIEFDVTFNQDFEISTEPKDAQSLFLGYCSQGSLRFGFEGAKTSGAVETYQTAILNSEEDKSLTLKFNKQTETKISLIMVDKVVPPMFSDQGESLSNKLVQLFKGSEEGKDFLYIGSYNIRIAEQIERLNNIEAEGVVRKVMTEGILHVILAMELQQHASDEHQREHPMGSLTTREMKLVKKISDSIKKSPEYPYSISSLCQENALSPAKLQEGFKLLHGTTVGDYIKNLRVEKAEELIRTTDLNISEVVYSVGLSSRSYFSKIFKKRYKCSPKNYQSHQVPVFATA